jgi:hypothetical protein
MRWRRTGEGLKRRTSLNFPPHVVAPAELRGTNKTGTGTLADRVFECFQP